MDVEQLLNALDESEATSREPPIGDTTLRNPLVQRVFDILNHRSSDTTGHCSGMLREVRLLGFRAGDLDPARWAGLVLLRGRDHVDSEMSTDVTLDLRRSLGLCAETLAPICNIVVDFHTPPPRSLVSYAVMAKSLTMLVLKTATKDFSSDRMVRWNVSSELGIKAGFYTAELQYGTKTCVVPRDFLLMVSDIVNSRHQILAYMYFSRCLYVEPKVENADLAQLFSAGDKLLATIGQEAYVRFKLIEPYTSALLIESAGPSPFNSEFSDFIKQEVQQFKDPASQTFFQSIRRIGSSPSAIANIFGLFRLWGHPILDSAKGRDRVKAIAQAPKTYDPKALQFARIAFRKWVCLGYYRRHGRWPNLDLSHLPESSEIRRAYQVGAFPNLHSKHYDNNEWDLVEGRQTFSAPTCLNTAVLLADKSHSLNRTQLRRTVLNTGRPGTSDQRRVLLTALSQRIPSVQEIMADFGGPDMNPEYLVIGLREKEREISPYARLFGLMTLPMRMYFVLTEHMLAKDLLPLFPESTMADNATTVKKKKLRIVSGMRQNSSQHLTVVMNIDFEKWNLNMRYENTEGVFSFLDQLYGTSHLFLNSHRVFERSTMYMCHGVHELRQGKDMGGDNVWTNHRGGIEGLRQKGWTLLTICVIKEVAWELNMKASIMGQGDNQVIALRFNLLDGSEAALQTAIASFMKFRTRLLSVFDGMSLPIKTTETWSSTSLFAYGKDLYFKGEKLGLAFKRASRCHFLVNEGFPSFHDFLGSAASAVTALNDETSSIRSPWAMYIYNLSAVIGCLRAYHPLLRRPLSSYREGEAPTAINVARELPYQPKSPERLFASDPTRLIRLLVTARSPVHGLPTLTPLDLLIHGFPDGLTQSRLCLNSPSLRPHIPPTHYSPILSREASPTQLCEDPTALPLLIPSSVSNQLRRCVSQHLSDPSHVENKDLARFFSVALSSQDELANRLFQMVPCNPRLMSDIVAATPIGQATAIVSQISSTTTLNRLMYRERHDSLTNHLQRIEIQLLGFLSWLWGKRRTRTASDSSNCPTEQARLLRRRGWGKDLLITVPYPIHYLSRVPISHQPHSVVTVRHSDCGWDTTLSQHGPFPMYLGSSTAEKLPPNQVLKSANVAPLLSRSLNLCRLIGWVCKPDSLLARLIESVFSATTDVPFWSVCNEDMEVTGCAEHRFADQRTSHMTNVAGDGRSSTHCSVGVASWTEYNKGSKNQTIHFQSILGCLSRLTYEQILSREPPDSLTWYEEKCKSCIVPTYDGYYDLPGVLLPRIPSFPHIPSLFLTAEAFSLTSSLLVTGGLNRENLNIDSLSFSIGVHAALHNTDLGVSIVTRLNGYYALLGYTSALMTRVLIDRILTRPNKTSWEPLKLARSCLDRIFDIDPEVYEGVSLLVQYNPSLSHLVSILGTDLLAPDIPLSKRGRCKTVGLLVGRLGLNLLKEIGPRTSNSQIFLEAPFVTYDTRVLVALLCHGVSSVFFASGNASFVSAVRDLHESLQTLNGTSLDILSLTNRAKQRFNRAGVSLPLSVLTFTRATYSWLLKSLPKVEESTVRSEVRRYPNLSNVPALKRPYRAMVSQQPTRRSYPGPPPQSERTVHDHSNFLVMPFGYPTSSWYKWMAVLDLLHTDNSAPACLADGAGGLARALYDRSHSDPSKRRVFYNTRPYGVDTDQFSYEELQPSGLCCLPGVEGLTLMRSGIGDLTKSAEMTAVTVSLRHYAPTLITCDAETSGSFGDITQSLTLQLIELLNALPPTLLVYKQYYEPPRTFKWVIDQFLEAGYNVEIVETPLSPRSSSECFLAIKRIVSARPSEFMGLLPVPGRTWTQKDLADFTYPLSSWRLPLNIPMCGELTDRYNLKYKIRSFASHKEVMSCVIATIEAKLISERHFPNVSKQEAGRVHYLSSENLSMLWLCHTCLSLTVSFDMLHDVLMRASPVLFLYTRSDRMRSSLSPPFETSHSLRIHLKKDLVFDTAVRELFRLLSMVSFFSWLDRCDMRRSCAAR
nr:TPA_asm: hypothetical protein [Clonorhabdovirus 2]